MARQRRRPRAPERPDLTIEQILQWCDAFHEYVRRWPTRADQSLHLPDTTWSAIDACLKNGDRGLNPGSSLAKLLLVHRGRRHHLLLPDFTMEAILSWADLHFARTGEWPGQLSSKIIDAPGETWSAVQSALFEGGRGLPGGSSLAQLLASERGVRNHLGLPPLSTEQIANWARSHFARNGEWPNRTSGPVFEAPTESWSAIEGALYVGARSFPGGSSLARLLQTECGVRNYAELPPLDPLKIPFWANAHRERTGKWPTAKSGPIPEAPGETWMAVDSALWAGTRGLPGGDSLTRFLARNRGKRNLQDLPPLTVPQILEWADAYRARTGQWPNRKSGPVAEAPGETWTAIFSALSSGRRGFSAGSSLAQLLEAHRGVRNPATLPPLTVEQIRSWADEYRACTGRWPKRNSGPIQNGPPVETWSTVAEALVSGIRGLPPGGSLARLLAKERGVRNHMMLPSLDPFEIAGWADAYFARTGHWPTRNSGPIPESPGETWAAVESALSLGLRGLPGESSIAKLLAELRGKRVSVR